MRQWLPEPFLVFSVALMLVALLGALTKKLMVPAEVSAAGVAAGRESLLYERRSWEQEAACIPFVG
jgi:hypothetical protein